MEKLHEKAQLGRLQIEAKKVQSIMVDVMRLQNKEVANEILPTLKVQYSELVNQIRFWEQELKN